MRSAAFLGSVVALSSAALGYLVTQRPLIGFALFAIATLGEIGTLYAIHRIATSEARASQLAARDPLTGLLNRRGLESVVEAQWSIAKSFRHQVAVLVLDLDDFKKVNDEFGHDVGDASLVATARALRRCAKRDMDFIARTGGDEFLILLSNTSHVEAKILCRRVWREIAMAGAESDTQLTASVGLAVGKPFEVSFEELFRQADQHLLAAKNSAGTHVSGDRISVVDASTEAVLQVSGRESTNS